MMQTMRSVFSRSLSRLLIPLTVAVFSIQITASGDDTAATVERALADLGSNSSETRRGSVMLLAKYPQHPSAIPAIANALEDPHHTVRRAAIVSLGENINQLNGRVAESMIFALVDSDPEVRMAASTWLPQLILSWQGIAFLQPSASQQLSSRAAVHKAIGSALRDNEAVIRRNTLEALRYLRPPLQERDVVHLFTDKDPQVRILAAQVLQQALSARTYLENIQVLVNDPDPRIRLAVTEAVRSQPFEMAHEMLHELARDESADVRLRAMAALAMRSPERPLPEELVEAMRKGALDASTLDQIFRSMLVLPAEIAQSRSAAFLEFESSQVRALATAIWLNTLQEQLPSEKLLRLLADPALEVRQQVLQFLLTQPLAPPEPLLMELVNVPFEDVRRNAFNLARRAAPETRVELALALLSDQSPIVRQLALAQIVSLRPPNWQRILAAALRDPSPQIRQTAVQALTRGLGPEGLEIAQRFIEQHPDSEAARLLRSQLPPKI